MLKRTVEFGSLGTRLSVRDRQLVVERPDLPRAILPIEDLGMVIVDDSRATYTQSVFSYLLEAGATVLVTGRDHLPIGMMLPIVGHHAQTERHIAQAAAPMPLRKRCWQSLVRSKIVMQATVLEAAGQNGRDLRAMVQRVGSGDPGNVEAQAAQRYWPRLFGKAFRRDRHASDANTCLNYGYAVIRAAAARALVGSGLIPSLGVFHRNRGNPFCLADDLMEPWRPFVDWRVREIQKDAGRVPEIGMQETRASILSLLNETVEIDGRRMPLLLGIQAGAAAMARALAENGDYRRFANSLPGGLPIAPNLLDAEA